MTFLPANGCSIRVCTFVSLFRKGCASCEISAKIQESRALEWFEQKTWSGFERRIERYPLKQQNTLERFPLKGAGGRL
ncbi:hypothetical protein TH25_24970 [Thalassospira profundimaris]|uniref:Uncharacterized protein n=2 Tax=Thalassospira profundimaris TaxID=502049 RepID=A0A367WFM1_9PROT|nr:hypothetical protein TH25_24970 [Thalassospira profundimaris]